MLYEPGPEKEVENSIGNYIPNIFIDEVLFVTCLFEMLIKYIFCY